MADTATQRTGIAVEEEPAPGEGLQELTVQEITTEGGQIFEPVFRVGGNGGGWFEHFGGADGSTLKRFRLWGGTWTVKAVEVQLTGAPNSRVFGEPGGESHSYDFQEGEYITELTLWGNGAGTRLGAIHFRTNLGGNFDHGMTEWGRKTPYPVTALGSGICLGVMGQSGADIDNIGFVFLKPVASTSMVNVQYPDLGMAPGPTMETIDKFYAYNPSGGELMHWEFSRSIEVTEEVSWSVTVGLEVYGEVAVKAGIPEVASGEEKIGWKVSAQAEYRQSQRTARQMGFKVQGDLKPRDSISLIAQTARGVISTRYHATIEVRLRDGTTFSYPRDGLYRGISYSEIRVDRADADDRAAAVLAMLQGGSAET